MTLISTYVFPKVEGDSIPPWSCFILSSNRNKQPLALLYSIYPNSKTENRKPNTMRPETPDHCATLGIKRGASNEELHAAYRRLALMHHPDKNRGNEEVATAKFQEVQRAFEALKDTEENLPPPNVPVGAQWDARPTATPSCSNNNNGRESPSSSFDANWGPNFDNRRWNEADANWFDERGWRTRSTAFSSQHPGFGVFSRFFTQLPPMPPLDVRVERGRCSNNNIWRETTRSFRLFA